MKKALSLCALFALCFSLCACASGKKELSAERKKEIQQACEERKGTQGIFEKGNEKYGMTPVSKDSKEKKIDDTIRTTSNYSDFGGE